ncbi:MAG: sulfur carrier protein ThiS adenylyltransferase ThiF [Proteobacteria bacterium]|nr:sulfur carrier protein ThiS adenylyltransferase ThiF [Pseudomonadota bacterium]
MNETERGIATHIGAEILAWLQKQRIGVAGAGGLGSNVAMHLVRSGFRRLIIADFDQVEFTNLNRQFYFARQVGQPKVEALAENLRAINPDLELELHQIRVEQTNASELFQACDAVIEAFDDPKAKKILAELILPTDTLLVSASGMGGCGLAEGIITRRLRPNFVLVGDMHTECGGETPPLSPMIGVAAAKQADVVLSYFLKRFKESRHA